MTQLTAQQLDDIEAAIPRLRDYIEQSDAVRIVAERMPALLAEIHRLTAELDRAREDLAFMGRTTLPELRRTVEHHKDGKQRWRERAEKAEARVAELERPAIEAKRNEIRQSFTEIAAQAAQDGDHEAAANFQRRLREREEQWTREDDATPA